MGIYLFRQRAYLWKQSSILISRSKNEAWFPWCPTLSLKFLGYVFLNYVRSSLSLFIAQSLSRNFETPWYSNALEDPFEIDCFIHVDSNK